MDMLTPPPPLGGLLTPPPPPGGGVTPTPVPVSVSVNYPSPWGLPMAFYQFGIAIAAGMFERWTWMRPGGALVMPWLWNMRVAMYATFALPGLLLIALSSNPPLPPFIGSMVFIVCALLNLLSACLATLPNEKEWGWTWFGNAKEKKKIQEEGGRYISFFEAVIMCPFSSLKVAFEKNTLGRHAFITFYFVLNVLMFSEAAYRHGTSNKGKALRGEPFYLCGTPPNAGPCPIGCDG